MIAKFIYKCRICAVLFLDPGLPDFRVGDLVEVENILRDSLRQNPTAKKKAAITETHLCGTHEDVQTVGVGDLVGYKLLKEGEVQQPEVPSKVLQLVRDDTSLPAGS